MNDNTVDCTIKKVYNQIEEFIQKQREYTEKTLTEIITNYDFIVGSKECKDMLMKILPEGASIVCSPFIESSTMIYAIKKFDARDFYEKSMNDNNVATWIYSDCRGCKWLHRIKANDGFIFHGCEHKPYMGKMVSELEKCPCTQEEYEKRRLSTGRSII